ncbi:hypothetical protein H5410_027454, partial [Solanum commersonii]
MDIKSSFCEERRVSHVMRIMDLPWVIMVNILSRLSFKLIFLCRTICKIWYILLTSDPLFVNIPIHLTPKFHFPPGRVILVGSCNGFIFFLNGA